MTLVKGDILSPPALVLWPSKQLGRHAQGWTGPSGTENKTLFQEKRRKLPRSPTHKFTVVYSLLGV